MGIPAVAIPQNHSINLANAFQKVKTVFAIYDQDKAGEERLYQWTAAIGVEKIRPVVLPNGAKDVTDAYVSSESRLMRTLDEVGLRSIL